MTMKNEAGRPNGTRTSLDRLARLYPFQTKERITKGPISGMTALFGRSFEVSDRRKCHRRAARVSQVKSLSHNTHGPAEALPPTAMGFGKMDKVELRAGPGIRRWLFLPNA